MVTTTKSHSSNSSHHPPLHPPLSPSGSSPAPPPSTSVVFTNACLYIASGCSQPLLMTLCQQAGLADPTCQLYMFAYALGPCLATTLLWPPSKDERPATRRAIGRASGICVFDILATILNYNGAALAGPTIFAIVYSSVTVWTALFSQWILQRELHVRQWISIWIVFGGLFLAALDSVQLGPDVTKGLLLVVAGSAMHALTYVLSEAVMMNRKQHHHAQPHNKHQNSSSAPNKETPLSVRQNCAIQSTVAAIVLGVWQFVYTWPQWDKTIGPELERAGTTWEYALGLLFLFALANGVHGITFYFTLHDFPGGSTSAGVMKGLQAVLVFGLTHVAYCGRIGGAEMCFSTAKFGSLVTVVGGVLAYGMATRRRNKNDDDGSRSLKKRGSYQPVANGDHQMVEIHQELA